MNCHTANFHYGFPFDAFEELSAAISAQDESMGVGDIVSLVVGGPHMVVISVCECGTVEVAWADSEGDVCIDAFPTEALYKV